jgi:antibiotic biosynthesis monooxygenase (ABM) superfamily enzyme
MNRRKTLQVMMTAAGSLAAVATSQGVADAMAKEPIQLHVELELAPGKEAELVKNFNTIFKPVISKQPGFVDVKLLKMRSVLAGDKPKSAWRLLISFHTEEQRITWVATDDHQRVWPSIEKLLTGNKYAIALYDIQ